MPSIRKRIGYLPSPESQEIISKIANNEKLSQSKVVGILVEESLIARGLLDLSTTNDLIRKNLYGIKNNTYNLPYKYNNLDELISDKGITYNTKKYKMNKETFFSESKETDYDELFEQFKQFLSFQESRQEK